MDTSSIMKILMNEDTLKMISKSVGISEKDTGNIVSDLIPELMQGASKQHRGQDTAASFLKAVMSHGEKDSADMSKFIKGIDLDDGVKAAAHLLGKDKGSKVGAIAKKRGVGVKDTENVMALLAPMLLNQIGKGAKKSSKKDELAIGDLLGSVASGIDTDDIFKLAKSFLK